MTGALSLPVSAYARLTALLPVKPSGLPSRSCPILLTSNHTPVVFIPLRGEESSKMPKDQLSPPPPPTPGAQLYSE